MGDKEGTSAIEFGWEGDVKPQDLEKQAELILGSLFQEMVCVQFKSWLFVCVVCFQEPNRNHHWSVRIHHLWQCYLTVTYCVQVVL